jgi:hypothetical protein
LREYLDLVRGYEARVLEARHAALESAFFTAALVMHSGSADGLNKQHSAFLESLDPTPPADYREEAEAAGLHPPTG